MGKLTKFIADKREAKIYRYILQGEGFGRDYCLNLGAGAESNNEKYINVDIHKANNIDVTGDIRTVFAPIYDQHLAEFPDLLNLDASQFKFIRLHHVIEHIEWIYQERMFDWLSELLLLGGWVYIETPNLEYVAKTYLKSAQARKGVQKVIGQKEGFPFDDHPYLSERRDVDITRWFNAKAFSGCSTNRYINGCVDGDFHHCLYDEFWLRSILKEKGFKVLVFNNSMNLSVVAEKVKELSGEQ